MNTLNRQIKTGHSANEDMIVLIAKKDCMYNGKAYKVGSHIECTKSTAKRILAMDKSMFEIKLD